MYFKPGFYATLTGLQAPLGPGTSPAIPFDMDFSFRTSRYLALRSTLPCACPLIGGSQDPPALAFALSDRSASPELVVAAQEAQAQPAFFAVV
eukprot:1706971-Rhodomonas_salina.1